MLDEYINKLALVYLDDILVYSRTSDEHKAHLCKVFNQLCKHKIKAKCSKCEFEHSCIKYLGHVVGFGELPVDPYKVSVVADWVAPCNIKEV